MSLLELFCDVDDFCCTFEAWAEENQYQQMEDAEPSPL